MVKFAILDGDEVVGWLFGGALVGVMYVNFLTLLLLLFRVGGSEV